MSKTMKTVDVSVIRPAWEQIFCGSDPFGWPFRDQSMKGRVFFPTDGFHLTEDQFLAVEDALKQLGEAGFFLSIVESEGLSFLHRGWGHWVCDRLSYDEYLQLPLTLENALYSREGRWGILISHEMHALVAGSTEFVAALDHQYRGWPDDLRRLRDAWTGNPNSGWLELVTRHCRNP